MEQQEALLEDGSPSPRPPSPVLPTDGMDFIKIC